MRAIVTGMIGTYGVGGVVWDYAQYLLGLMRLGIDVYYLEDTGCPTYDPRKGCYGDDCSHAVQYLQDSLSFLSDDLKERWHFFTVDGTSHGIPRKKFLDIAGSADLFLNVSGSCLLRNEYSGIRHKVLIDTDPGWNHFVNYPKWDAKPGWQNAKSYRDHNHFLTYAENMGEADCVLPSMNLEWKTTRPLIVLDCWYPEPPANVWTTVLTWKNFKESIQFAGKTYGTKETEFEKIITLPKKVGARLEVAAGGHQVPRDQWRQFGWSVADSHLVSKTPGDYRRYIQSSRGEFSVAKNVYVATRSGWFSCRSICYLAAGRPVVVQDTGFSKFIPTGEGVLKFSTLDEAVSAIDKVEQNYTRHAEAARDIAEKYFNSGVVLRDLFNKIGLNS